MNEASVRAIERGMRVLTEVSRHRGMTPAQIAKVTGILRPSVYRVLSSLETLGYVKKSPSDNRFRVTILTAPFRKAMTTKASPANLAALQNEIVWPVDLFTYENGVMIVRKTTITKSPMAIDHSMIGRHAPILRTAAGRVWLAFAPDKEREICLNMLRLRNDPDDLPFLEEKMLESLLQKCREVGFGMRLGEKLLPKTSSIAMPVWRDGQIIACLTVIWITSVMSYQQARDTLVAPMRRAVDDMEKRLNASHLR